MSLTKRNTHEEHLLPTEINLSNGTVLPKYMPKKNGAGVENCEKTLLNSEPVRLTPAWEEKNLPSDELNFKTVTMEEADLEGNPPKDRLKTVFFIMMLHGIGILLPFNMFITAKAYFVDYKLSKNYTNTDNSMYTTNFISYVCISSQIPSLIFSWLNVFIVIKGSLTSRIVWSIIVEILIFTVTVVLIMVNTSEWPVPFFWITMGLVFVLNGANAIYQTTMYGVAAKLPAIYTSSIILGNNLSGTFIAVLEIITYLLSPDAKSAAIYYFVTAIFVLLICFDTYFALPLNRFYRYHDLQNEKAAKRTVRNEVIESKRVPYWKIFKTCFPQCFNVFLVFFVTLAIFPAIYSDIKRTNHSFSFIKDDRMFVNITCFFTFNFFAMLGNLLTTVYTKPGPDKLIYFVLVRILFIPLFTVFNYQPAKITRIMPVLITDDLIYWVSGAIMAFTSGYFSSLAMMYCSKTVQPQYAVKAGMFGAASLLTGIFSGIALSTVFPWLVTVITW